MNRNTRIQKISEDSKDDPIGKQEIMWKDQLQAMDVYQIRLENLIYNKYNGRILSSILSLDSQNTKIDPESNDGEKAIEQLLWDSKPDRNKRTEKDIETYGQKKVGIITKEGVIIDGNRRVMFLNRLKKYNHFKAIILPIMFEENPIEIEKLETSYQMGEDEKLGYNPIEKYLKAKRLMKAGISVEDIANWMGETVPEVNLYLDVMKTMDDYLDYLEYNGMFTQLYGREDQLIQLTKWIDTFENLGSSKAFDGYTKHDVDDLNMIAFDYIRVKYEGKKFRYLGYGQKQNHFFGNKKIWESFKDTHFKNIKPIYDDEEKINLDSLNLSASLVDRDGRFKEKAGNILDENLVEHQEKIYNRKHKDEPGKLITKAIDAVNVVKNNKNIGQPEVMDMVAQLNESTTRILQKKSPLKLLEQIFNLLSTVTFSEPAEKRDELLKCIKNIEKEAYQLEKKIKTLE